MTPPSPAAPATPNIVQVVVDQLFVYIDTAIGNHLVLLSISHAMQNVLDQDIAMLPGVPTLAEIKPTVDATLSRLALWAGKIGWTILAAKLTSIQAWFDQLVGSNGANMDTVPEPALA